MDGAAAAAADQRIAKLCRRHRESTDRPENHAAVAQSHDLAVSHQPWLHLVHGIRQHLDLPISHRYIARIGRDDIRVLSASHGGPRSRFGEFFFPRPSESTRQNLTGSRQQVEKLFDVACTLIDVMSCVPLSPSSYEMGPREYLNRFLALISSLRSGQSRYLPTLQNKVSEVLPSYQLPLQPRLDMYANPPEPHAPGPGEPSAYPHPSSSSLRHAHDMTPRYPTQEISSIPSQLASPTNYPPFTSTMQYQDPTTSAGMGPSGPYQTHLPSRPGYPS